ncbi:MAG: phospholipase A2 [Kofleriaceae bacterium]
MSNQEAARREGFAVASLATYEGTLMKTSTLLALCLATVLPLTACVTDADDELYESDDAVDADADPVDLTEQAAFVGVPRNYVYNPSLGPLHDYCTKSPDEFPNPVGKNANFRGPCARHDLCLGSKTARTTCDNRLKTDLQTNCKATYGRFNPVRSHCLSTALIYWAAVRANTATK